MARALQARGPQARALQARVPQARALQARALRNNDFYGAKPVFGYLLSLIETTCPIIQALVLPKFI